jgi:hypothetical protein
MTRKTIQKKRVPERQSSRIKTRKTQQRRRERRPLNEETIPISIPKTKPKVVPEPEFSGNVKSHRFISSMIFDGDKLITQTQKDYEPVKRHEYTKEDLERELPIGKELVDNYLDGVIPQEIQQDEHKMPVLTNVLISPVDLGLMPPKVTTERNDNRVKPREHRLQQLLEQYKRKKTLRRPRNRSRDNELLQLIINEEDDNYDDYDDIDGPNTRKRHKVKQHNLFDLN